MTAGSLVALLSCAREAPSGAQLYASHCARCHGADGRGDVRSRGLNPNLDSTRSELLRGGGSNVVYRRIAYGYGSVPGCAHKLEQEELLRLADYTQELLPKKETDSHGS